MIDLYFWGTPNGYKICLALEELALPHRIIPVNIARGEQFRPQFLTISPTSRIPAIVDLDPVGGGAPVSLFESGAILLYLAEKTGQLIPEGSHGRAEALQWLFWQVASLGPFGQFSIHAPETTPYAIDRYKTETTRLYSVLDNRLAEREFIAGEFSIADIACYPWIVPHENHGQNLGDFRHLKRWFDTVRARPATRRAYEGADGAYAPGSVPLTEESRGILFGRACRLS